MQRLVYSMRETMPYFVSSLRNVDEWKRSQAKRSDLITQSEYDANVKNVKSPYAKSLNVDDLQRYIDDTVLDITFMTQLPTIEKCLNRWWEMYATDKESINQEQLRSIYTDLAIVLVEAKSENIHKNSVSMILRSPWTKWSPKEAPLTHRELSRLLFILGHLMTPTDRLVDYVKFFDETFGMIDRYYQSKNKRLQLIKRRSKAIRDVKPMVFHPNSQGSGKARSRSSSREFIPGRSLTASNDEYDSRRFDFRSAVLSTSYHPFGDREDGHDGESTDGSGFGEYVSVFASSFERAIQTAPHDRSYSDEVTCDTIPVLPEQYSGPMVIARLRSTGVPPFAPSTKPRRRLSGSVSTPVLPTMPQLQSAVDPTWKLHTRSAREDEMLRRSLSRVPLQRNKLMSRQSFAPEMPVVERLEEELVIRP